MSEKRLKELSVYRTTTLDLQWIQGNPGPESGALGSQAGRGDKRVRHPGALALVEVKYVVIRSRLSEAGEKSGKIGKNK